MYLKLSIRKVNLSHVSIHGIMNIPRPIDVTVLVHDLGMLELIRRLLACKSNPAECIDLL